MPIDVDALAAGPWARPASSASLRLRARISASISSIVRVSRLLTFSCLASAGSNSSRARSFALSRSVPLAALRLSAAEALAPGPVRPLPLPFVPCRLPLASDPSSSSSENSDSMRLRFLRSAAFIGGIFEEDAVACLDGPAWPLFLRKGAFEDPSSLSSPVCI